MTIVDAAQVMPITKTKNTKSLVDHRKPIVDALLVFKTAGCLAVIDDNRATP